MAWKLLITQATRHQFEAGKVKTLLDTTLSEYVKALVKLDRLDQSQFFLNTLQKGNWLCCSQARFQSSFLHNLSRRLLGGAHATTSEVAQKNDPEAVIREFESQSSLHANPAALSEYVKALVKLDRLDQSQFFLNTLQRGLGMNEEVQPATSVESNATFGDYVKGANNPKVEELKEIIDYLRDPECFARLGAELPKGYLLAGPIGTSKIRLAYAIAREAGVPFFSCNGRDFETHLGYGARRMKDLFVAAKKQSRSIIFIDEIDKIHTKMTINQLIVELDGLKQKSGIIVIAAACVPDSLDKALLKQGRFDRRADFLKPDEYANRQLLYALLYPPVYAPPSKEHILWFLRLQGIMDETRMAKGS